MLLVSFIVFRSTPERVGGMNGPEGGSVETSGFDGKGAEQDGSGSTVWLPQLFVVVYVSDTTLPQTDNCEDEFSIRSGLKTWLASKQTTLGSLGIANEVCKMCQNGRAE